MRKESFVHVEGNAPLLSCYLGIEAAAIYLDSPRIICAVCACARACVSVSQLTSGQKYIVRVRARNHRGESGWSKGHQGTFRTLNF